MKIDDNELRRLFRTSVLEKHPRTRKKCPDKNNIAAFFRPWMSRRRKHRIIDHIASCAPCSEEFDFLLGIHRQQEKIIRKVNREIPASVPHSIILRYAPLAAGIFLFVFISLFFYKNLPQSHGRGEIEGPIQLIQPCGQTPPSTPLLFKWESDSEAEYYVLEIFDTTLLPFIKISDVNSNFYLLPQDISNRMQKNEPYYWIVTAVDSGGHRRESRIQEFILN